MSVISEILAEGWPDVLSMDEAQRNEWNLNCSGDKAIEAQKLEIENRVRKALGIRERTDEADEYGFRMDDTPLEELNRLNRETIAIYGKTTPEGYFLWNEFNFSEEEACYDSSKSLLDVDRRSWEIQNELLNRDEEYSGPYLGYWIRTYNETEGLTYVCMDSLLTAVMSELEDKAYDLLDELAPYDFVSGPEDGKRHEDGSVSWDKSPQTLDPNDQGRYDLLKSAIGTLCLSQEGADAVRKEISGESQLFVFEGEKEEGSTNKNVIVGSPEILDKIHVDTFWGDIESLHPQGREAFEAIVNRIWAEHEKLFRGLAEAA